MRKIYYTCILALLLASCNRYAYYQSPLHTNDHTYKTIPLHADSTPSAIYASGVFTTGGANDDLRDGTLGLLGNLYRAHNFGSFQAHYGITGSWGQYKVDSTSRKSSPDNGLYPQAASGVNDSLLNAKAGRRTFGSLGAVAGINYVLPLDQGEWRALGVEIASSREFGSYLDFREEVPVNAVNMIDKHKVYWSIMVSTEILGQLGNGNVLGFKVAYGGNLRSIKGFKNASTPYTYHPGNLNFTLHFTSQRITCFTSANFGRRAFTTHLGLNVGLSRLPERKH